MTDYARKGRGDGSSVYVYRHNDGYRCQGCSLVEIPASQEVLDAIACAHKQATEKCFVWPATALLLLGEIKRLQGKNMGGHEEPDAAGMVAHLLAHRDEGHTVPQDAIDRLLAEASEVVTLTAKGTP